jgi:hypothetical protein
VDEELMEGLSFLAYRRVATTIYLPLRSGRSGSVQAVRVDPRELDAALRPAPGSQQPAPDGPAFPEAKAAALVPQARKDEWDSRTDRATRSTCIDAKGC